MFVTRNLENILLGLGLNPRNESNEKKKRFKSYWRCQVGTLNLSFTRDGTSQDSGVHTLHLTSGFCSVLNHMSIKGLPDNCDIITELK